MTWTEFVKTARIRSVEEADAEERVWDAGAKRTASMEAAKLAGRSSAAFLAARAQNLEERASKLTWLSSLDAPKLPGWLVLAGWLLALAAGGWLAVLGQEGEINLLALPLIGLLAWNAVVIVWCLLPVKRGEGTAAPPAWFQRASGGWGGASTPVSADAIPLQTSAGSRFSELLRPVIAERFASRLRVWLHVAAALLALGSIGGMYTRGWSKEYRAVWESTLLDDAGATRFFGILFKPAAKMMGTDVPVEQVPEMRRRIHAPATKPGEALPWIHLYSGTLLLFVVLPRALLAALDLWRAGGAGRRALRRPDWNDYAQSILSMVDGQGSPAFILTHGLVHDEGSQSRWRQWAYRHWRDLGRVEFQSIPVGREPDFMTAWKASSGRVMVVFNMAGVPEEEVQRWLVESLLKKPKDGQGAAPLVLLALDDTDVRKRWSGFADSESRLADRAQTWKNSFGGLNVSWV